MITTITTIATITTASGRGKRQIAQRCYLEESLSWNDGLSGMWYEDVKMSGEFTNPAVLRDKIYLLSMSVKIKKTVAFQTMFILL